jgi:very-short-patch-repair endonuclease
MRKEIARARSLRRTQTDAELKLWLHLRDRRLEGLKFRRQVPIEGYYADFVCKDAMLIVELDGGQHAEYRAAHDQQLTEVLDGLGYRVIRFWNNDLFENIGEVLRQIVEACQKAPHPSPLPQAGEGAITTIEEPAEALELPNDWK